MTPTQELRIKKTYRGGGRGTRTTVWAVQEIHVIGDVECPETIGTYATKAGALAAVEKARPTDLMAALRASVDAAKRSREAS